MSSFYPYADEYPVVRGLPEHGRPRDEILRELHEMAEREDASWENGKVSGSMYCGDHEHYAFLDELRERGSLEQSGPFTDRSGGAYVLLADGIEEATQMAARDPLHIHDCSTVTVREWNAS